MRYVTSKGNPESAFIGLILKIQTNKKYRGITICSDNQAKKDSKPKTKIHKQGFELNLEPVILEDIEFNKKFTIYSNDQVEARYILTPSFMERIKNLQDVFSAKSLNLVFDGRVLYLFLNMADSLYSYTEESLNFFEIGGMDKTLINRQVYKKVLEELISIFSLIDYLKIDNNTGL